MRRGTLFLPRRFFGALDEGSIRASDEGSGEELEVSFTPPRQLEGLGPFFEAHELKPNDAVRLRLEEGSLVLGVVLRERRTTPEAARPSAAAPGHGEAPNGQGSQSSTPQGEAQQDRAWADGRSAGATGAERRKREGSWGDRDPEQFGVVRERRVAAEEHAPRDPGPQEPAPQEVAPEEQAAREQAGWLQAAKEQAAAEQALEERERGAQEFAARKRAEQARAALERVARERAAQDRAAQEQAARARAAQEREAQELEARRREAEQREAQEREARQQAAHEREQQESASKEAGASERAAKERKVDAELTAPPTAGWQKVLHDPAPPRTQGVPVSPEELGKVDNTTEIWKRYRSRSVGGGETSQGTYTRKDEAQSRSKATETAPRSAADSQGGLPTLDAGGPEAWHLSPRDLSRADAAREASSEDDGLWVKETRRPKAAPATPLAPGSQPESRPQPRAEASPEAGNETRSGATAQSPAESRYEPLRQESARNQAGLFDSSAGSEAEAGEEREKVAVSANAGSESNAASRVSNYLRDPGTPAIVRAPAIAESLGLPLGDVQRALEDVSRSSEGSVTPIRADVYLVKRNRQED